MDAGEINRLAYECAREIKRAIIVFAEANAELNDGIIGTCIISALSLTFIETSKAAGLSYKDMREGMNQCIKLTEIMS
jgi:hypothetical protein